MKSISVFSLLLFLFAACDTCRNEKVPALFLKLEQQEPPAIYRIYNEHANLMTPTAYSAHLPLSLGSDTTTYYFQNSSGTVTDTLSIRYTRKTSFEDTGCGFFLSIQNIELLPSSSFDSVEIFQKEPFLDITISIYE